jgi:hypothetical protein
MEWPLWWTWDLELTPHLEKRMEDRQFSEIDLRTMLHTAAGYHPDVIAGRFVVDTTHTGRSWEVIVEPDDDESLLVVITAYPVDR